MEPLGYLTRTRPLGSRMHSTLWAVSLTLCVGCSLQLQPVLIFLRLLAAHSGGLGLHSPNLWNKARTPGLFSST